MRKKIIELAGNEFVKGGVLFTVSSFIAGVLNYFFNLLAAHGLGPLGFGEITALFSYTIIFSVPMLVISLIIIEKLGSKEENAKNYAISLENWFLLKLKKWWFVIVLFTFLSPVVPRFTNLSQITGYFLIPLIILSFLNSYYLALLQGLKFFEWVSLLGIVSVLIKLAGSVFVVLGVDGISTIIFFLFVSSLCSLYFSHKKIKHSVDVLKIKPQRINKRILDVTANKQIIITFFSILALSMFNNADIIFVKKFLSPIDAGIYSSWSLFAKIILYLVGPIIMISFIFFSSRKSEKAHEKVLIYSLILLFLVAITSFIFYKYFSFFLIRFFFGYKFDRVAPLLSKASIFGSLYTAIYFINNYFLAKKSRFSLILAVIIPIYLILLFIIPNTLNSIIYLNIYFSSFVTLVYLVAYGWRFFYNVTNGKEKR